MVISAAGDQIEIILEQFVGHGLGVLDDLLSVGGELRRVGFGHGDGDRRQRVHVGTALQAGEDRLVHGFRVLFLAEQHAATGAAEGLMRRGRDHIGVRHRALVDAGDHQAGNVGDVADEVGADLFGDLAEDLEVDDARICGGAADDDLGPMLLRQIADQIEVQSAGLRVDLVGDRVEEFARHGDFPAVGQVTAVIEGHTHDRLARFDQRCIGRQVGHRTGVGLDVGVIGTEELFGSIPRQVLDQVGDLLSLIITLTGIAFRVFIGQTTGGGCHPGSRDIVL